MYGDKIDVRGFWAFDCIHSNTKIRTIIVNRRVYYYDELDNMALK